MYFGMQIRFANTHTLLGLLSIDDAVGDMNNVNSSIPIVSITHSEGNEEGKHFMHTKFLKKKLYGITGSPLELIKLP